MRPQNTLDRVLNYVVQTPAGRPVAALYLGFLRLLEDLRWTLLPTEIALMEAIMGNYGAQAVHVAARLGIGDRLADGPRSASELARDAGCDADQLFRLLRFLEAKRVVRVRRDGRFQLSRHGRGLIGDAPRSFKAFAEMNGAGANWRAWGALLDGVKHGEAAFKLAHGREFWDYTKTDPEFAEMFDRSMVGFSEATIPLIASAYKFGPGTLVDVGGGRGALLAGILKRQPELRGVLFDMPEVVRDAPAYLEQAGVGSRVAVEAGSFFDGVPKGHDYYVLKNVLHDWGDKECLQILGHVADAIKPGGRLLLAEILVKPREAYPLSRAMDIGMMVLTRGGRERTRLEYEGLLAKTGFRLSRVVSTTDFMSVLVAEPRRR